MRRNTDWMRDARWGVMFHYLLSAPDAGIDSSQVPASEWNDRVDAFNLRLFVRQLRNIGAGYVIFTIGQNSGHYCSPNPTYDQLTGITPSKCSRRDLIGEMADALNAVGIRLIAYLPSHPGGRDHEACVKLKFTPPWDTSAWGYKKETIAIQTADERITEGQRAWEAIIRDWSQRWGRRISGWWIDGCYFADRMYRHSDEPNFSSFAAALRAGNPDALLAFNCGTKEPFAALTDEQDYTAGEVADKFPVSYLWRPLSREMNGLQLQVLTFLGECWGMGEAPRCPREFVAGYTQHVNSKGGVVTWDVPIGADGVIAPAFLDCLAAIPRKG